MSAADLRLLLLATACADRDQELRLAAWYGALEGGVMGDVYQEDHAPEAGETVTTEVVDDCERGDCPNAAMRWQGTLEVALGFQGDASGLCEACDLSGCTSSAWTAAIEGDITVLDAPLVSDACGPVEGDPPDEVSAYDVHIALSGEDGEVPVEAVEGTACSPSLWTGAHYDGTIRLAGQDPVRVTVESGDGWTFSLPDSTVTWRWGGDCD